MENYLKVKKQFNDKKELFNKVIETKNLSDFLKAIEYKAEIERNEDIRKEFFANLEKTFLTFLPKNKYKLLYYAKNELQITVIPKHEWSVKYTSNINYKNSSIFLSKNGSTKASFKNEEIANDFNPFKDISKELAKYMEGINQHISRGEGTLWFRSFLDYMPLPAAQNVSCPVLILHGDKDTQVPVDHAHLLAKAIRISGNKDVTVKIFSNHNHVFLKDSDGSKSRYKYLLWHTNKLSKDVLKTITEWLSKHLAEE